MHRDDNLAPSLARLSRRRLLQLTLSGGAALALAACGRTAPVLPNLTPTPTGVAAGAGSPAATRRLRIAVSFAVSNLNPLDNGYWLTSYGTAQTLYYVNPDETIRPWIASAIDRNGDAGWTVKLNPAAKFHNGRPIDARAVQSCLERYIENGVGGPSLKGATWDVPDAQTLRIRTAEPDAWLPYSLANALDFPIFDVSDVPPKPDPASLLGQGIFSGAFRVADLTPEQLTLDAFPGAWDGPPKLAGVDVRFVRDPQARLAALQVGEVDMMLYVPADAVPRIKATPGLSYKSASSSSRIFVVLNHRRPPLNDVAVRRAIALGIDRQQIADQVLNGTYDAPDALYPAHAPWSVPGILRTDVGEAKKLLDAAGWTPGPDGIRRKGDQRLSLEFLHYPQQPDSRPMAEAVQAQLKAVGVELRLKQVDDITAAFRGQNFDAGLTFNSMQSAGNPVAGLERYFLTDSRDNYGGWGSAELDGLIKRVRAAFDPDQRDDLLRQIQHLFARDVPITFTVSRPWSVALNQTFAGYVPTSMVDHYIVTKETRPAG